jgi:hypothetical protein
MDSWESCLKRGLDTLRLDEASESSDFIQIESSDDDVNVFNRELASLGVDLRVHGNERRSIEVDSASITAS